MIFIKSARAGVVLLVWLMILCHSPDAAEHESLTPSDTPAHPPLPAFPGAVGYGAFAVGGRGGRVIAVTRLSDSGPGSLRAALEARGPRIVVFKLAGTVELQRTIRIKHPYLTVAGQTAPGAGITLRGREGSLLRILPGAHDIVIRFLRLRNGSGVADGNGHDNISISGGRDIILDHLSLSWSSDENLSIWKKTGPPVRRISIQYSLFAEGLAGHSNGLIIGGTDEHWQTIQDITLYHNLFVNNSHRNPRVTAIGVQVINNVVYNWKARVGSTTYGAVVDLRNNLFRAGPLSDLSRIFLHESLSLDRRASLAYPEPSIHTAGNIVIPGFRDPAADNWPLHRFNFVYLPLPKRYRRANALPDYPQSPPVRPAFEAYYSVLANVGANSSLDCNGHWSASLDSIDRRLITETRTNTGPEQLVDKADPSGYPAVLPGGGCVDSDADGMPDRWEERYGFDPADPKDSLQDANADGYTNIEEYLNGSDPL